MGGKKAGDKSIVVNYKGELLEAQLRMNVMKHFIEEQEWWKERRQETVEEGRQESGKGEAATGEWKRGSCDRRVEKGKLRQETVEEGRQESE